ncbi:unnamed protein product [Cylicocyclus nassatus]|uniref:G-protein coupled receptors family 1 profile domain-containing protein n=1 Tax=Cylicocyclus nassatus TaxID=53992 RepID=A0AA36H6Z1_CYLNA|nr:unnamed protein product [Cylicocyclus nassatus]
MTSHELQLGGGNLIVYVIENKTEYCETEECESAVESIQYATVSLFILSYVIPVIILATMCYQIAASVRSTSCNTQTCIKKTPNKMKKLLIAVVVSFLICWSPHQITLVIIAFKIVEFERSVLDVILNISECCLYLNCAVNPILYNMFSRNFRRALQNMISGGPNATAKATCSASVVSKHRLSLVSSDLCV